MMKPSFLTRAPECEPQRRDLCITQFEVFMI
jgi:hypothetical protein